MRPYLTTMVVVLAALATSCGSADKAKPSVVEWPDAEVFMLPVEAGFQDEKLELREGRFRYHFASDVVLPNPPKYPVEGSYTFKDGQLSLNSGQTFSMKKIKGVRTLWKPKAESYWDSNQIIDVYGILLEVSAASIAKPTIDPLFTKEQRAKSAEQVRKLQ